MASLCGSFRRISCVDVQVIQVFPEAVSSNDGHVNATTGCSSSGKSNNDTNILITFWIRGRQIQEIKSAEIQI